MCELMNLNFVALPNDTSMMGIWFFDSKVSFSTGGDFSMVALERDGQSIVLHF